MCACLCHCTEKKGGGGGGKNDIVEEVEMEGNRNDMKHSHYDTSSNDGVESSTH